MDNRFKVGDTVRWDDASGKVVLDDGTYITVEFRSYRSKPRVLKFYKDGSFLRKADMAKLERGINVNIR